MSERDNNAVLQQASAAASGAKGRSASQPSSVPAHPSAAELVNLELEGEDNDTVPIFATCDDIRKQMHEHLARPGVTQAGFGRDLSELIRNEHVTGAHMRRFLDFKGPRGGAHSPAFYAGYVYFEKIRLRDGKKKSAKRQKLEDVWKREGGFPREGSHNVHAWCRKGESWKFDYLGQFTMSGRPSGGIVRKKGRGQR